MQNPDNQKSRCPVKHCKAERGEPCRKKNGQIAAKVHWNRPLYSARTGVHPDDWKK